MGAPCLPAGELLACVIYRGDYPQIGSAFATLGRWLLASGYEATGPCREVYHRSPAQYCQSPRVCDRDPVSCDADAACAAPSRKRSEMTPLCLPPSLRSLSREG